MDQLRKIDSENELKEFLKNESEKHLENFIESGRQEGLPFDQIFKKLKKTGGRTGLSNSEVILSSALWSVYQAGCEIELLSLADVFPHWGEAKNLDLVKETVLRADALLISTPVYFGDRSSLANDFIDLKTEAE